MKQKIGANKIRQSITDNWITKSIILLLLIPTIYSFIKGPDKNYWDGVMSSWLATLVGVIVGIPIALWINRKIQAQEDVKEKREAKKKNIETLKLIRQELIFNKDRLNDRQSIPDALQKHPYQVDVWEAFSSSGVIRWIANTNLLNRIASVYSIIKIERSIEQNCYLAAKGAFAFSGTDQAVKSMLEDARSFDKVLKESLNKTLSEIDAEL